MTDDQAERLIAALERIEALLARMPMAPGHYPVGPVQPGAQPLPALPTFYPRSPPFPGSPYPWGAP